jgi:hypothetical protein
MRRVLSWKLIGVSEVGTAPIIRMSVCSTRLHGDTTQKAVIFYNRHRGNLKSRTSNIY